MAESVNGAECVEFIRRPRVRALRAERSAELEARSAARAAWLASQRVGVAALGASFLSGAAEGRAVAL